MTDANQNTIGNLSQSYASLTASLVKVIADFRSDLSNNAATTDVSGQIASEIQNRESGDAALQQAINAEAAARDAAIKAIVKPGYPELSGYATKVDLNNAQSAITTQIQQAIAGVKEPDTSSLATKDSLSSEAAARQDGDSRLQSSMEQQKADLLDMVNSGNSKVAQAIKDVTSKYPSPIDLSKYATVADLQSEIAARQKGDKEASASIGSSDETPVGAPIPWPTATAPSGWMLCNGASFDKVQCPQLAAAYPSGNVPDMRGLVIRGYDASGAVDPQGASRGLLSYQEGSPIPRGVVTNGQELVISGWYQGTDKNLLTTNGTSLTVADAINIAQVVSPQYDYQKTVGQDEWWAGYSMSGTTSSGTGLTGVALGSYSLAASFAPDVLKTSAVARMKNMAFNYIVRMK